MDSALPRVGPESFGKKWARRVVTALATVVTVATLLIAVGTLLNGVRWLGAIATLFESIFSEHIVVAGLLGLLLAFAARWLGGRSGPALLVALALLATLLAVVPVLVLIYAAHTYGAKISWREHLDVAASGPRGAPDKTLAFAIVDGKALSLDVYLPRDASGSNAASQPGTRFSAPVVMIHGGGYSGGQRSDGRNWDHWLAAKGYTVFDVEYRLDPPVTWNLAAPDVLCAMSWVEANSVEYHVDTSRMLVAGQSAGGGLALQVAYGVADGTFASSCPKAFPQSYAPPTPKAVFALYPPDDFAMAWNMNTGIGPVGARKLNTDYIGGSPQDFPDRYRAVSAVAHVRPGFPPTLIAVGEHDHLVPFAGHRELVKEFEMAGVPYVLVAVPFSDHAYDAAWGSLGAQITRQALSDFLAKYLPATSFTPPPRPAILENP
jgi:acetyl esterase/lipase